MSCEIIQFSTAARVSPKRGKAIVKAAGTSRMSRVDLEQEPEPLARDEGELTVTCQNKRLRDRRRDAWREADTIREYWKARLEMESGFRALRDTACLKAITIPRTIPMTAGRSLRTIAKRSCNSRSLPRRTLRRSPGSERR